MRQRRRHGGGSTGASQAPSRHTAWHRGTVVRPRGERKGPRGPAAACGMAAEWLCTLLRCDPAPMILMAAWVGLRRSLRAAWRGLSRVDALLRAPDRLAGGFAGCGLIGVQEFNGRANKDSAQTTRSSSSQRKPCCLRNAPQSCRPTQPAPSPPAARVETEQLRCCSSPAWARPQAQPRGSPVAPHDRWPQPQPGSSPGAPPPTSPRRNSLARGLTARGPRQGRQRRPPLATRQPTSPPPLAPPPTGLAAPPSHDGGRPQQRCGLRPGDTARAHLPWPVTGLSEAGQAAGEQAAGDAQGADGRHAGGQDVRATAAAGAGTPVPLQPSCRPNHAGAAEPAACSHPCRNRCLPPTLAA